MWNQIRRCFANKTKAPKTYSLPSISGYEAVSIEKIGMNRNHPSIIVGLDVNPDTYQQVAKLTLPRGLETMVRVSYHPFTCLGKLHLDIYPVFSKTFLVKGKQVIDVKKYGHGDE
jgi:hypothetical protein